MIARNPFRPAIPQELSGLFEALGIELAGVADCAPAEVEEQEYRRWLERRYHGTMAYLERHAPMKYHPEVLLPGCRSVLAVGINYFQDRSPDEKGTGRIARYAWGRDYHRVLGKRLKQAVRVLRERYPNGEFRSFTDATPLAERFYAERAGIAFTGKNTLSISSSYGSWFLIGEILSTVPFSPSGRAGKSHGSCPSGCVRCSDVCPTGALEAPYRIDASRCISYLTIENRGPIPVELRPLIGDWIFGCDLCQEVCPLNIRASVTKEKDFLAHRAGPQLSLREILSFESDEQFTARFAGSPVARAGRRGLMRNACVAAANVHALELLPLLESLAAGSDELIAEHAQWAVSRLLNP
ncbi:MAG TPA: tRNA epoxyqueuosine(34) reductase QueG [Spirochaetia bacterium]|nr:tRNA epoxyqueuosine(34) reductase QueG [Spirochaetia bacterium]